MLRGETRLIKFFTTRSTLNKLALKWGAGNEQRELPIAWNLPCIEVCLLSFSFPNNRSKAGFRFILVVSDTVNGYVHTEEMVDGWICVLRPGEIATDWGRALTDTSCASHPTRTAQQSDPTSQRGEMHGISWAMVRPLLFFSWRNNPLSVMASSLSRLQCGTQTHTHTHRNSLDGWSAWSRDLYLTTHNTHNRQTSMSLAGFEPAFPASERPQTHALDRAATGIGLRYIDTWKFYFNSIIISRALRGRYSLL